MTDRDDRTPEKSKPRAPKPGDDRQDRLQQALRANLHRRKAQSRARATDSRSDDADRGDA